MKDSNFEIKPDWKTLAHFEPEFHGATLIADDGSEIPITEHMLQQAFAMLIRDWESGRGDGPKRIPEKSWQRVTQCAPIDD